MYFQISLGCFWFLIKHVFNKLFITTLDTTSLGKQLPKLNLKQLGTYSPIFTRQGIVPRTSTESLDKRFHLEVGLEDARDVCQPIRTTFSIRIQWIYSFSFPLQPKTLFVYAKWDLLLLVSSDSRGDLTLSSNLVKGICRLWGTCTISLYLDVGRWIKPCQLNTRDRVQFFLHPRNQR